MKQAVVIGATSCLGEAIVKTFVENDYSVIGTSRKQKDVVPGVRYELLDLSSRDSINSFCESIKNEKVDALVFTVSDDLTFERFENIPIETFEQNLSIGVTNTVYLVQQLLQLMNKDGSIVFTLSEMTVSTPAYFSSYVTAKFALLGFMKALAQELKDIRVNAVSPGLMNTPFIDNLPDMLKKVATQKDQWTAVEAVAEQVLALCQSEVSGENVLV